MIEKSDRYCLYHNTSTLKGRHDSGAASRYPESAFRLFRRRCARQRRRRRRVRYRRTQTAPPALIRPSSPAAQQGSQARVGAGRAHRGGSGTQRPGRCRERPRARLRGMVRRLQPARGPAHCRRPSGAVCASSGQTAHRANPSAVARCHQRRAPGTVPPHRLVIRARWQPRAAPAPPASRSQPGITCTAAPRQISPGDGKARGWADGGYRVRSATTRLGRCGDHPPGRLVRMVRRHQPPRGPAR